MVSKLIAFFIGCALVGLVGMNLFMAPKHPLQVSSQAESSYPSSFKQGGDGWLTVPGVPPRLNDAGPAANLIWAKGTDIVVFLGLLLIIGFLWPSKILLVLSCSLFAFSFYFFRNPQRVPECADQRYAMASSHLLLSPADGVIDLVDEIDNGDHPFLPGKVKRVALFLSPLDVHVNWIPCDGKIVAMQYHPGAFVAAFEPKCSEKNERNELWMITAQGTPLMVRQVAGFVARRICSWVLPQQVVSAGEKFGMIRFGSRVEMLMPLSTELDAHVVPHLRVYGGQSVLGSYAPSLHVPQSLPTTAGRPNLPSSPEGQRNTPVAQVGRCQ